MNHPRNFPPLPFFVPEYTGPLPEFDPGDVAELVKEIMPVTEPVTVEEKHLEI